MNKQGIVKSVSPAKRKDGTFIQGNSPKSGKPWTLYNVILNDGFRLSGFEIPLDVKAGSEVFIDYEVEKNGNFTNNKIKSIYAIEKTINIDEEEESGTMSQSEPNGVNFGQLEARVAVLEGILLKKDIVEPTIDF